MPSMTLSPETYYLESYIGRVLADDVRERILKMCSAAGAVDAAIYIKHGSAAKVVRAAAEDHSADLVVIGRGAGNGNPGRLRTDSYAIIRESPCPVISI
jgi:nucleotide-binding universal stress UspA family protein